jgi:molybdopterin-guanine dinucleotide biosynthesis protein A
MNTSLKGLVLAGGRSLRMGRDKASMVFGPDDTTRVKQASALLRRYCTQTFLSLRAGQPLPNGAEGMEVLADMPGAQGPLCGILAAFHRDCSAAWLVLACDMPFVTEKVLSHLVDQRQVPGKSPFLAFASGEDGLPEPLCAIYEPAAFPILERHAKRGHFSPRSIMVEEKTLTISLPLELGNALASFNSPTDLAKFAAAWPRAKKTYSSTRRDETPVSVMVTGSET